MNLAAPQLRTLVHTSGTTGPAPFKFARNRDGEIVLIESPENRTLGTGVDSDLRRDASHPSAARAWMVVEVPAENSAITVERHSFDLLSTAKDSLLVWVSDGDDTQWRDRASNVVDIASVARFAAVTTDEDMSTCEASRCIDRLVFGDGEDSSAWHSLTCKTSSQTVVRAGLDLFKRKGSEERLIATARVLEAHGASAFPALTDLCESGIAEADYFIEPLFTLLQIDEARALRVIDLLFRNTHSWVIRAAFDILDNTKSVIRHKVLSHLAEHVVPEVAASAVKRLQQH